MSVLNFEEYISEASIKDFKSDKEETKAVCEKNKDRIGKSIINADDSEVSNSIVLSVNTMAIKTGDKIAVRIINKNYGSQQVFLTIEEVKELIKLV